MFALFYGRVVVHALEEKSLRRQRRPSVFAVAAGEDARHGLRRKTPRAGLTEGSCKDAHHVVEVAVRRHRDVDVVAPALNVTGRDGAHGVAVSRSRAARGAEGEEIVLSHKILRRLLHLIGIQPPRHFGAIPRCKGRVDLAVVDAVEIGLGVGRIAGVEIVRHHPRFQRPDVRGQMLVQRQRQLCRRDAGVGVEVEHEAQRVDAGVGTAAALDVGPTAQHRLQGVLKRSSYAPPVGLHLKPAVVRAVVG